MVKAAADARPDLMNKAAVAMMLLEKESPEFAADLAAEFNLIATSTVEKVAASGPSGMSGYAKGVAGLLGSALAGAVATDLYDAAKRGLTKGKNFNRIMDMNPDLKRYDKGDLKKSYDTLHMYAPEFTADPNMGGQVLHRLVELPQDQHNMIKELINARKNLRDVKRGQFSSGSMAFSEDTSEKDMAFERAKADYAHGRSVKLEDHKGAIKMLTTPQGDPPSEETLAKRIAAYGKKH
jgi:hypothetical protein